MIVCLPRDFRWVPCLAALFAAVLVSGCLQTRTSEPSRTAVEQLLLSRAAAKSLAEADLEILRGRKVWVSGSYYESVDKSYVLGLVREKVAEAGA